jgi:hypothetical protein
MVRLICFLGFAVVLFVLIYKIASFFLGLGKPTSSPSLGLKKPVKKYDWLSGLPYDYYGLAIICGVLLIGFTIANADELSSTEIGWWIVYTFGTVLSLVTIGRVVRLLQQIRDVGVQIRDVGVSISNKLRDRNSPALSPGRSDESNPPEPRTGDKS